MDLFSFNIKAWQLTYKHLVLAERGLLQVGLFLILGFRHGEREEEERKLPLLLERAGDREGTLIPILLQVFKQEQLSPLETEAQAEAEPQDLEVLVMQQEEMVILGETHRVVEAAGQQLLMTHRILM